MAKSLIATSASMSSVKMLLGQRFVPLMQAAGAERKVRRRSAPRSAGLVFLSLSHAGCSAGRRDCFLICIILTVRG
jgi:hypothetical protein